jgi:hypothetical protein
MDFDEEGRLYVGAANGGCFVSTDFGSNWTEVPTGLRSANKDNAIVGLLCFPGRQIFINVASAPGYLVNTVEEFGVYMSTNGGTTWKSVRTSLGYDMEDANCIAKTRDNWVLAGLSHGLMIGQPNAVSALGHDVGGIHGFALQQNYPNPFNPSTTISYLLPKPANVTLRIFNTLGQEVAMLVNEQRSPGYFRVQWNADVPTGIYFYRLQAGEFVDSKKMILLH